MFWHRTNGIGSIGLALAVTTALCAPCRGQAVYPPTAARSARTQRIAARASQGQTALLAKSDREVQIANEILAALDQSVSVDFDQTPLNEVAQSLQDRLRIPIRLDSNALNDASIPLETPITLTAAGVSARTVLDAALRDHNLNWVLSGEFLVVTTDSKAKEALETRVYPVLDLVLADAVESYQMDFDSIIELMTSTISPTTWDNAGGAGSVAPFEISGALVISQTREVHEQIENLFARLRQVRHLQHMPALDLEDFNSSSASRRSEPQQAIELDETPSPARVRRSAASNARPAWQVPHVYH